MDETNANGCPHFARGHRLEHYKSSAGCLFLLCVCVCVPFSNGMYFGWFALLKMCICSWLCCVSKALFAVQGSSVIKLEGHKSVRPAFWKVCCHHLHSLVDWHNHRGQIPLQLCSSKQKGAANERWQQNWDALNHPTRLHNWAQTLWHMGLHKTMKAMAGQL